MNTKSPPPYAELHCLSNFTFLRGASHPEELVERAQALGYAALAITDECSLAGAVRAHVAAKACGLHLLVGSELQLDDGTKLVLLAQDRNGYGNLSALITLGRRRSPKGEYRLSRADLAGGLPGCLVLWLPAFDGSTAPLRDGEPATTGEWLATTFPDRAWIGVELHLGSDDAASLAALEALGDATGLPLTACGDVHMHRRGRRALQDLLTATRLNTTVAEAGFALFPNGERHLRSRERLARLYPDELLAESVRIAGRCTFSLDELRYNYPHEAIPAGETPASYLRRLTEAGMAGYWPEGAPRKVRDLVEHELAVIAELGYEPYFITVYDLVRFARSRNILCQGRGSAANSAVCYCLGITAVDPSRAETLFERFISKERGEPPDIDVDFEHQRREVVLLYLYERYGREHAALAATVIRYRTRSALRDVGRALGFSSDQLEQLASAAGHRRTAMPLAERLREAGFDPQSATLRRLLALVEELRGFPRHLSQHVGGMVLTRDPLIRMVPVENAAMEARTVIQWDKDDLDAIGLLKVDCLALGMLSAIHRCFDLVERHRGRRHTLANVPAEDPATYAMIRRADTVGVFQIESRAQMAMLPRLAPRTFYDLVVEVAIIRPGPIQGNMVHPYLKRRQGLEPVIYPGPEAEAVLKRTLGVPIFQEQVIKLAMVAAGFSAGEADRLRRAMAAWKRKGGLEPFEDRLRAGMAARGYATEFAEQVIEQIRGFGEYGFPESHAASFALLAYVSAWLKCHEPAAFVCALLNSQPMGFYAPTQLVRDAREHGVEVRPVDVQASEWECTLEGLCGDAVGNDGERPKAIFEPPHPGPLTPGEGQGEGIKTGRGSSPTQTSPQTPHDLALRLGLRMARGLGRATAERIVTARKAGPFRTVTDLARRADLEKAELERLAAANALEGIAGDRHQARWEVLGSEGSLPLFDALEFEERRPPLPAPSEGQALVADYASTGLSLGRHPLALLRERLHALRFAPIAEVAGRPDRAFARLAGIVITRQRPGDGRTTFLTLEDESGIGNVIVWERLGERYRREINAARLLGVTGHVQSEGGVVHFVARRLEDLTPLLGGLMTRSRDFC